MMFFYNLKHYLFLETLFINKLQVYVKFSLLYFNANEFKY